MGQPKAKAEAKAEAKAGPEGRIVTLEELAKHKTTKDVWIAMNGGVYNATQFLDDHPGGPDLIMGVAGKDATTEFDS